MNNPLNSAIPSKLSDGTLDGLATNKKRRKRSKKKKSQVVDDSDSDEELVISSFQSQALQDSHQSLTISSALLDSYHSNHMGDPIGAVISDVLSRSNYSEDTIRICVTNMWDKGLQYDNAESVLMQLRLEEKTVPEPFEVTSPQAKDGKAVSQNGHTSSSAAGGAEGKLVATKSSDSHSPVQPAASASPTIPAFTGGHHPAAHTTHTTTDHSGVANTATGLTGLEAILEKSDVPIGKRLEVVAGQSDLLEAVTLLCSWASLAVGEFKSAARMSTSAAAIGPSAFFEGSALEILLQSLFSLPHELARRDIRTALCSLLQHVLYLPVDCAPTLGALLTSLDAVAAQAGSLVRPGHRIQPLTMTPQALARRVGASVRRMHSYLRSQALAHKSRGGQPGGAASAGAAARPLAETLRELDSEMSQIEGALAATAAAPPHGKGEASSTSLELQHKLTIRDIEHDKLMVSLKCLEAMGEASADWGKQITTSSGAISPPVSPAPVRVEGSAEENVILEKHVLADFGETPEGLEAKRAHGAKVAQHLERLGAEKEARLRPLRDELDSCNKRLEDLQQQQIRLQQQLQAIQVESAVALERRATVQTILMDTERTYDEQRGGLASAQQASGASGYQGIAAVVHLREGVQSLLQSVRALDNSLAEVAGLGTGEYSQRKKLQLQQEKAETQQQGTIPEKEFPARIAASSAALAAFAATESKCMSLLSQRVVLAKAARAHRVEESAVYRGLSMQAMVAEMESGIRSLTSNIEEDVAALAYLQKDLVEALLRFAGSLTVGTPGTNAAKLPMAAIADTVTALREAGVQPAPELLAFMTKNGPAPSPAPTAPAGPSASANGSGKSAPGPATPSAATTSTTTQANALLAAVTTPASNGTPRSPQPARGSPQSGPAGTGTGTKATGSLPTPKPFPTPKVGAIPGAKPTAAAAPAATTSPRGPAASAATGVGGAAGAKPRGPPATSAAAPKPKTSAGQPVVESKNEPGGASKPSAAAWKGWGSATDKGANAATKPAAKAAAPSVSAAAVAAAPAPPTAPADAVSGLNGKPKHSSFMDIQREQQQREQDRLAAEKKAQDTAKEKEKERLARELAASVAAAAEAQQQFPPLPASLGATESKASEPEEEDAAAASPEGLPWGLPGGPGPGESEGLEDGELPDDEDEDGEEEEEEATAVEEQMQEGGKDNEKENEDEEEEAEGEEGNGAADENDAAGTAKDA